jgi:hypothetical protein
MSRSVGRVSIRRRGLSGEWVSVVGPNETPDAIGPMTGLRYTSLPTRNRCNRPISTGVGSGIIFHGPKLISRPGSL